MTMPAFDYRAVDASGREVDGNREAKSISEVQDHLYQQGLVPISVKPSNSAPGATNPRQVLRGRSAASMKDPLAFTQELSRLLSARINVERSLSILAKEKAYPVAADLLVAVRKGLPLAQALQSFPDLFDQLYINMIRAGESAGVLADTVSELTRLLERQKRTKDAIRSSTLYPLILMFASGGALMFLLGYVVPQFEALLISSRVDVGGWLGFLFSLSNVVTTLWIHGLVGLLAVIILLDQVLKRPKVRAWRDEAALKVPALGKYISRRESARFARVLGIMLKRHISPVTAVEIATATVRNAAMEHRLDEIREVLVRGEGLATPLAKITVLPPIVARMAEIGEETGELGGAFEHAADILDAEIEADLKTFLAVLEPAIILIVGALVGGIVISILSALMSVTDYIG